MKIKKIENFFALGFSFIVFFSFIAGFILRENSAGAGGISGDFYLIWKNLELFKNGILDNLNSQEYNDSRTPLAYILHVLFNPFIETQNQFRLSVLFISMLCPIVFYLTLREKYKNIDISLAVLISSLILLSPYFRTTAFWGLGENYAILFVLISYLLFQKINFVSAHVNNKKIFFLFLLTLSSSLCVYFDQKLLIIPFVVFISIIFNKKINNKIKILLICFYLILSIPLLYLIFLWGSILPPDAQSSRQVGVKFNIFNIGYASTIISFYLIPFLFFQKEKFIDIFINFFKKENLLYFVLFLVYLFFVLFFADFSNVRTYGQGVVHKFISLFWTDINLKFVFTLLAFFISWIVLCIFLKNRILDKIIIYYFLIVSFFIYPVFQEYFDPIIIILIFTFFQKKIAINFKNISILTLYLSSFLILANFYYLKII
jgi:hypothetical protein